MPVTEAMFERVLRLTDHVIATREEVYDLKLEVKDLRAEVKEATSASKGNSEKSMLFWLTFLKDVMPPKAWVLVIFLLLASMLGIISPQEIIEGVLSKTGHEKTEHSGSS